VAHPGNTEALTRVHFCEHPSGHLAGRVEREKEKARV